MYGKIIFNNINLTDKATKEYRYKDEIDNFRRGTIIDNSRGKNLLKVTKIAQLLDFVNSHPLGFDLNICWVFLYNAFKLSMIALVRGFFSIFIVSSG